MEALKLLPEHLEELKTDLMSPAIVFGSEDFGLTNYMLWAFVVFAIFCIVIFVVAKKLTLIPNNKFVNFVEYGYQFVCNDICKNSIGHGYRKHIPFLATLFFFIIICNFVGLIPGAKAGTGSVSVTWALALISFVYFNFWGIKAKGGLRYLKSLVSDDVPKPMFPFIWVLEFMSMVLRLLTLSVRLYGNMFAGHMVLGIFSILVSLFTTCAIQNADFLSGLPAIIWFAFLVCMYALECLVAFLQAYVFTTLSAVYISLATSEH